MHKEKNRRSQVQNWSTASASLRNFVGKSCKRLFLTAKSVWIYVMLHVRYGTNIEMSAINSIKGKFTVELLPKSSLRVGSFLMSAGPCYIKCTEKARCRIGEKVFMNHNCSITCAEEITIGDACNIANNVVIVDHDQRRRRWSGEHSGAYWKKCVDRCKCSDFKGRFHWGRSHSCCRSSCEP